MELIQGFRDHPAAAVRAAAWDAEMHARLRALACDFLGFEPPELRGWEAGAMANALDALFGAACAFWRARHRGRQWTQPGEPARARRRGGRGRGLRAHRFTRWRPARPGVVRTDR